MCYPINLFFIACFIFICLMPISNRPTQGNVRLEAGARSKTNGSHTWVDTKGRRSWVTTHPWVHTRTKGHPKPSERQVNMVCSWTMTFSCRGGLHQPSRWPLGPHAHSPWLADGAELLNHSVSRYVFWYVGRSARWGTFDWNKWAETRPRGTEVHFMGVFINPPSTFQAQLASAGYPRVWAGSIHNLKFGFVMHSEMLFFRLVATSGYLISCCLSMVSNQSTLSDLWALASTRHFPPQSGCSRDISSFMELCSLNLGTLGCDVVKIPVHQQQLVNHSDLQPNWHQQPSSPSVVNPHSSPSWCSAPTSVTYTKSTCLNALWVATSAVVLLQEQEVALEENLTKLLVHNRKCIGQKISVQSSFF